MEPADVARRVISLVEDKQAHDIVLLDIRQLTTIADFFVICSGDNERQLRAIVEYIDDTLHHELGLNPRIEGTPATGWIVMDYGDMVIHVFGDAQREFYQIERIWNKAVPVVVVQ
ncbi:MAG: ribosome silencing factor [Chloroflexaceae bacterium]|nr:ribosome silencing factor [Chloroflexaceae bacterium]